MRSYLMREMIEPWSNDIYGIPVICEIMSEERGRG
jgi:hypothetical protein